MTNASVFPAHAKEGAELWRELLRSGYAACWLPLQGAPQHWNRRRMPSSFLSTVLATGSDRCLLAAALRGSSFRESYFFILHCVYMQGQTGLFPKRMRWPPNDLWLGVRPVIA